mgnify:CR=1 FL=1
MERKKASDFPPAVLTLCAGYIHGMTRPREFLHPSARTAVGGFPSRPYREARTPNHPLPHRGAQAAARTP